jgi:hypothetical protein
VRRFAFRTVSQITVNYRGSALSAGQAGKLRGGDRLPWVRRVGAGANAGAESNFAALTSLEWQLHVYGESTRDLPKACEDWGIRLHMFPWQAPMKHSGLKRGAAYLIRPDGYIALAAADGEATTIHDYLRDKNIRTMKIHP